MQSLVDWLDDHRVAPEDCTVPQTSKHEGDEK
jgi:hypothetical protein